MSLERIQELERTVVDAWPAAEVEVMDGWLLRASGGPTHRGNSVATLHAGAVSLDARIAASERWYRERGQPPMFQLGPCALPAGLDAALSARGYIEQGASWLAAVAPAEVVARTRSALAARVERTPSAGWLAVNASSRFSGADAVFAGFVARLGARCYFATAYADDGAPTAACLGVASPGRVGVYAMHTIAERRRQGAARAVLHALAMRAHVENVPELYLMAQAANSAARALYAASGFVDVYRYHYRRLAT
jgi:N-acetylglutamate synthase